MKEFQVRLEQIGGCGDGGCMIHVRPGMHTNGGCRCSTDPLKMRQTVHTYKGAVAEQAQEIERLTNENWRLQAGEAVMLKPHLGLISRLTAEIERLRALVETGYEEGWVDATCQPMGFDDNWNHSITRAALQPKEGNQ